MVKTTGRQDKFTSITTQIFSFSPRYNNYDYNYTFNENMSILFLPSANSFVFQGLCGKRILTQLKDLKRLSIHKTK